MNKVMELIATDAQSAQDKKLYDYAVRIAEEQGRKLLWRVRTRRCVFVFAREQYYKALFVSRVARAKIEVMLCG